jgi:hypothetical protein
MKNSKIFALAAFVALLFGALPINAQTQRLGSLIDSGKDSTKQVGTSTVDGFVGLSSKATDALNRIRSKASADGTQDGCGFVDVTSLNNSGAGTLRDAIASVQSCGIIVIKVKGTINLTETIEITEKNIDIVTEDATTKDLKDLVPDEYVVNGSGITDATNGSVFVIQGGADIFMGGFTITGGKGLNRKGTFGGGICLLDGSFLTLTGMTIRDNTADFGGGIFAEDSDLFVQASTISGNTSIQEGGGIAFWANSAAPDLVVLISTIANNSTGGNGGGVSTSYSQEAGGSAFDGFANSTISGNTAGLEGGGVYHSAFVIPAGEPDSNEGNGTMGLDPTIENLFFVSTIVSGNTISADTGIGGPDIAEAFDGRILSLSFANLIGIYEGGSFDASSNIIGTAASPADPDLGTLAANGGPTKTMALPSTSPAIDAGVTVFPFPIDQRGLTRPVIINGGPAGNGTLDGTMGEAPPVDGTDIGAYELQAEDEPSCDLSEVVTYSQGGWSSTARNAPLTNSFFTSNFSSNLVLGSTSNNRSVTLTSVTAVRRFLPQGGTAAILKPGNLTDPTNKQVKNVLAGQTAAAILNFALNPALADAELATGLGIPLEGTSVSQLITLGNNALGSVNPPYSKNYLSRLSKALEFVNLSFSGGTNQGFLVCSEGAGPAAR